MTFRIAAFHTDNYSVQTSVYQGPLDLLLDLIESAQLDITALALSQVTDQYLAYMNQLMERDPEQVSAFLVIAAKLLQIKSSALLPRPSHTSDPEEIEENPAEALAQQLREYKRIKDLSRNFAERENRGLRSFIRFNVPRPLFSPKASLEGLTLDSFLIAARRVFTEGNHMPLDQVMNLPRIRIKDKITTILQLIRQNRGSKVTFRQAFQNSSRIEIVVSFLALLELIKQFMVVAEQDEPFGEIVLLPAENFDANGEIEVEFIE